MRQPDSELGYPILEHLPDLVTTADWLDEELRTSGSGADMRIYILDGLGGEYRDAELDQSLRVHAQSLDRAYTSIARADEPRMRFRTHAFYSGALLGMHAELGTKPLETRAKILDRWDGDKEMMRSQTADFMQWDSDWMMQVSKTYHQRLEQYPKELRDAIISAAAMLYDDRPDDEVTNTYRWTAVFGSVYAIDTILGIEHAVLYE